MASIPEPARKLVLLRREGPKTAAVQFVIPHGLKPFVRDRGVGEFAFAIRSVFVALKEFRQRLNAIERGLGPWIAAVAIGTGRLRIEAAKDGGA